MNDCGYAVVDVTDMMSHIDNLKSYHSAVDRNSTCFVEFLEMENEKTAQQRFVIMRQINENSKSKKASNFTFTINDYSKYELTSNGEYKIIIQKNNTVLYIKTAKDNKQEVDFLLSEAGKNAIVELHVEGIKDFIRQL
jgi:hypothetical protein